MASQPAKGHPWDDKVPPAAVQSAAAAIAHGRPAAGQDASAPDVSMDNSGNALVGWQRTDGSKLRVQAAIRSPGG